MPMALAATIGRVASKVRIAPLNPSVPAPERTSASPSRLAAGIRQLSKTMAAVSLATPLASPRIFDKWFVFPEFLYLSPLPVLSAVLFAALWWQTFHLPKPGDRHALMPFLTLALIFALGFAGLAWSFYPFVVPDRLTIWQAASAPESLGFILVGTVVVLPVIIGASFFVYRVFSGKATELHYD